MSPRWIEMPRFLLDHRFAVAHVSDYLDGDLGPAGSHRIERHAEVCPQCRQLIARLRQTLAGLRTLGGASRPGLADEVVDRLQREG